MSAARAGWYERRLLPRLLDCVCNLSPIREQRRKLVPLAHGRVLEIGIGTGLNLEHYDRQRVTRIIGLDPAVDMNALARKRVQRTGLDVELVSLTAERIPFADSSFDSVVVTYSLCTIPDPLAALREMRRVLKPGAPLIFCEHGRSPDASVQRWQQRLNPPWSKIAGGCHLDRDVPTLLRESGFVSDDLAQAYLPGPRAFTYHYWGTARAALPRERVTDDAAQSATERSP